MNNVGLIKTTVPDVAGDSNIPLIVLYPTNVTEKSEKLGPYELSVAIDAPVILDQAPLVLISHGTGGSNLVYRDLAYFLTQNGYVIGLLEHPHNNNIDNSLENTIDNLQNRPRHIINCIKWFKTTDKFKNNIDRNSISIIGHSMGGYTALATAGGEPTSTHNELKDTKPFYINVEHYHKIKSIVLLTPATVWYIEGSLKNVKCPTLMLFGEQDKYISFDREGKLLLNKLKNTTSIEYEIIKNAGHFSFISQFPEFMRSSEFAPSQDPPGFDRQGFHIILNNIILNFLNKHCQKSNNT